MSKRIKKKKTNFFSQNVWKKETSAMGVLLTCTKWIEHHFIGRVNIIQINSRLKRCGGANTWNIEWLCTLMAYKKCFLLCLLFIITFSRSLNDILTTHLNVWCHYFLLDTTRKYAMALKAQWNDESCIQSESFVGSLLGRNNNRYVFPFE